MSSYPAQRSYRGRSAALRELATLLARGFLRLLAARQRPEIAPIPDSQESPAGSPNCLDVPGRPKHELDREEHP